MLRVQTKKDGRITERTRDDFLGWVKKQKALKNREAEKVLYDKALAVWLDDGGTVATVNHQLGGE